MITCFLSSFDGMFHLDVYTALHPCLCIRDSLIRCDLSIHPISFDDSVFAVWVRKGRRRKGDSRFLERLDERVLEVSGDEHVLRGETDLHERYGMPRLEMAYERVRGGWERDGAHLASIGEAAPEDAPCGQLHVHAGVDHDRVLACTSCSIRY